MWQAAWYDLNDGMSQLIHLFLDENKALFSQQRAIHIVLVLIMVRPAGAVAACTQEQGMPGTVCLVLQTCSLCARLSFQCAAGVCASDQETNINSDHHPA